MGMTTPRGAPAGSGDSGESAAPPYAGTPGDVDARPDGGVAEELRRRSDAFSVLAEPSEDEKTPPRMRIADRVRNVPPVLALIAAAVLCAVLSVAVLVEGGAPPGPVPDPTTPLPGADAVAPGAAAVPGTGGADVTPAPVLEAPDPAQVQEALDYEAGQVFAGAFGGAFAATYDYTLTFFTAPGSSETIEVSGTASLVRRGALARLAVLPAGADPEDPAAETVVWLNAEDGIVRWCDEVCHDMAVTAPPDVSPGSPWSQATVLAVNLDPAWLGAAPRPPVETTTMTLTESDGATCTLLSGVFAGQVVTSQRCWDGEGQVVSLTTTGQSVRRTQSSTFRFPLELPAPPAE
jgi:hypothetical protein